MATVTVYLTTTGAGTWTVPAGVSTLDSVETIGGGGSAGRGQNGVSFPAGGGGAAYSKIAPLSVTPSSSIDYTVGAAGTQPAGVNRNGNAGGDTWFNGTTLGGSSVGAKGGGGGIV